MVEVRRRETGQNPVYLGQARSGLVVKENAHEAIVSRADFDAVQSTKKSLLSTRDGSVASQAMLGGLARWAGCGHTLKITGSTRKGTGERYAVYYCMGRYASGPCPARATEAAPKLDAHVEQKVLDALRTEGGPVAEAIAASNAVEEAARAVNDAEHELDLFVNNPKLLTMLGEQRFIEGVESRQTALDEARAVLAQARAKATVSETLTDGDLLKAWPTLPTQDKRRLMHGLIERIEVTRAKGSGNARQPISERTTIILRGGSSI